MNDYSLTERGLKFLPVLTALEKWAIEYQEMDN
ncbi:winged helix-turn-helix transcriptional regulator [Staphylococcus equorum]